MKNMSLKDYVTLIIGVIALGGSVGLFFTLPNRVERIEDELKRFEVLVRQDEQIKALRKDFEDYKDESTEMHKAIWRRIAGE